MILINLLPHREAARKRRREAFYVALGLAALGGGVIAGAIFLGYEARLGAQRDRNLLLQGEIARLDVQIKGIATLQGEIASLRARQQAVENLQADRNQPVHLLNELALQVPEGIYLTSLKQDAQNVSIQGMAQSNERVSELLRNIANRSAWLTQPELVEIVTATPSAQSPREQRRLSTFTVRMRMARSGAADGPAAATAASAASGAPR